MRRNRHWAAVLGLMAGLSVCGTASGEQERTVLELDGASTHVVTELSTDDLPEAVSFEAWVYSNDLDVRNTIFGGLRSRNDDNRWNISAAYGQLAYEEHGGAGPLPGGRLVEQQWHHVAAVRDGSGQVKLYVDGRLVGEIEIERESLATGTPLFLGARPEINGRSGRVTDGYLSELRIWQGQRSAEQIEELMFERLSGDEDGLIAYWPLDEGEDSIAQDGSGNGHDGQIEQAQWATVAWPPELYEPERPLGLFLTWQQDPTTTMTLDWHVDALGHHDTLRYKPVGTEDWQEAEAESHPFPHSSRTIKRVELTGLEPDTAYRFQVEGFSNRYKFETMPESIEDENFTFAAGGDTDMGSAFRATNRAVMEHDPKFIVWGGDLSYSDGSARRVSREYRWFEGIMDTLITDEGRVVPILVGVGNHEMWTSRGGGFYRSFPEFDTPEEFENYEGDIEQWRRENAPYFYGLFAWPGQPGYGTMDFGDYLSIIMLDSDHSNPVQGKQTEWLEQALAEREHVTHVMPKYHHPGPYSSRRRLESIGEHWIPLFEQHGVNVVFENHDHTYKRTHPIREGQVNEHNGIVYLGDGAWGRGPRRVQHTDAWYMAQSANTLHAYIVTLRGNRARFMAIDRDNEVFDRHRYVADARRREREDGEQ